MSIRNRITQFLWTLVAHIRCSQGNVLIGRVAGPGPAQELTIGSGLLITGTTLSATGGGGGETWETLAGKPTTFPPTIGSGGNEAVAGNDARLTNARNPTEHNHDDRYYTESEIDTKIGNARIFTVAADYTILPSDSGSTILHANGLITLPNAPALPISFFLKGYEPYFTCSSAFVTIEVGVRTARAGGTSIGFAGSEPVFAHCSFFGDQWVIQILP